MEWVSLRMSRSQFRQSLETITSTKFDNIVSLQAIEDRDEEKRRADRLEQRLTILERDNEEVSCINFHFYQ